jgi:hypothetical protein
VPVTRSRFALVALACAVLAPAAARADDSACIAASEQELALRQQGKLHDALKQLAVCADASCPDEVKTECARRVADVDAAMPTLILGAKDGAGNDRVDVRVLMDGAPLLTRLDGLSVAIDPGSHVFRFETEGQDAVEKTLVLREGEKERRETVVLGPVPVAPPATVAPAPPAPAVFSTPPPAPPRSSWTTQKTLAVLAAGLGVAGVGVGAVLGGYAISSQDREKSDCGSASSCPRPLQAKEDYDKATQNATAATVFLSAGAALVAVGAVLWFTAKAPESPAPRVGVTPAFGPGGGGVLLTGEL